MPIMWKLQEVLDDKKITAYQLAKLMGAKHATIYRLAKRTTVTRVRGETLVALCDALKCKLSDLMEIPPKSKR